ncbi:MAG: glycoside hydrolase family 13 protein [Candidatus Borkfalkiaceae bacterium]|nr:glycoside hydrolase family 13 protein [Clostridia bacterium]MDY6223991.1 glycoside hydrolase family 13 protein [Christensenellaceae bacterium]
MQFYYNPLDKNCKEIRGGVREGQPFRLRLFCFADDANADSRSDSAVYFGEGSDEFIKEKTPLTPEENACLLIGRDGEKKDSYPMTRTAYGWSVSVTITEKGLYFYCFYIQNRGFFVHGNRKNGRLSPYDDENFLLTVSTADYVTPDWLKGGIMYQIFPDRFCRAGDPAAQNGLPHRAEGRILRSDWGGTPYYKPDENGKVLNNDFFGGNLQGIKSRLPYLKSLGVSAIYLNPIFEAASNHRYDTSDYMKIDPLLGTEEDLRALVNEAETLNIRIILDGVFNHTGDNSVYFNKYGKYPSLGAYQSKDSPYFSWYTFQRFPDKYSCWWGIDILPEVNEESEEYRQFILGKYTKDATAGRESGVLKKWLSFGIGGFRLDVADELPDFFLKKLRKSVKESNEHAVIIGEVWEDASCKIAYSARREYLQGEELDSVMNYPLKNAIVAFVCDGNSRYLSETVADIVDHYPKETLDCLMNILGTHDTPRILTVLAGKRARTKDEMASESALLTESEKEAAVQKLKIAALLQFTLPGVPCVYYGDETGMEGFGDPFCRKCFDFSRADRRLIGYYQRLGAVRQEYADVFKEGEYREIFERNGCFAYMRRGKTRSVYVCANMSHEKFLLTSGGGYDLLNENFLPEKISLNENDFLLFVKDN